MNGIDWVYIDADKGRVRLNVKAVLKDADGAVRIVPRDLDPLFGNRDVVALYQCTCTEG